ncbi:MAG: AMP-binding protein, partial [Microthrixaceae bacterium]
TVDSDIVDGATRVNSLPSLRCVRILPILDDGRPDPSADSTCSVLGGEDTEPLAVASPVGADDAAYIVYTSGSTAAPKPALCPHRSFLGAAAGVAHGIGMGPEDRFLAMLPTFHTGGVTCVLSAPHLSGGCTQLLGMFEPSAALASIEEYRCTVTMGFDTMYTKMMGSAGYGSIDTSTLRRTGIGATPSYIEQLANEWGFDRYAALYGSTESGALAAITPPSLVDPKVRRESNGQPLPGVDMIVVEPESGRRCEPGEPGEICFRGWGRMLEYVDMPEENLKAIDSEGYFHSGDYGYLDDIGNLYYRGRYKMMIKTGGENVSEREVEIFLESELEPVTFAQVVGVPDPTWGEAVVAFVSVSSDVTSDELRGMAAGKIAKYKIPKKFYMMGLEEFPTLANGRPDKSTLREMALEAAEVL